jgi:hypothetical protein
MTAVLAMLYMALFSTLALGFYASVTTAVQVARNEQRNTRTLLCAESGMAFTKFHLANLGVPADTPPDQLFDQVYNRLCNRLNGYPNLGSNTVGINATRDVISIPAGSATIQLDDNSAFQVTISKQQNGQQLRVKVIGNANGITASRKTQLDYSIAKNAASIFDYGVASKSYIAMNGNVTVKGTPGNDAMGSVLSATTSTNTPLSMTGGAVISGDVSFVLDDPSINIGSNCTIAGNRPTSSAFADHVHSGIGAVEFPVVDTAAFIPFVPAKGTTGPQVITSGNPSGTSFTNIRIKAGTNPTFNNNTTIQGVVVIESPNQVKFSGQVNITGAIVVETLDTQGNPNNANYNLSANTITFAGGVSYQGIDKLPTNDPTNFPDAMRQLTGSMLLAPGFDVQFKGNFGAVGGSIIGSQLEFSGTAGGTITGSVLNLRDSAMTIGGTSDVVIQSVGTSNYPAGVFFGSHYTPLPKTYVEALQ